MIEASVVENLGTTVPTPIRRPCVKSYLRSLSSLCVEVARSPQLLPSFVRILRLTPGTLAGLQAVEDGHATAQRLQCLSGLDLLQLALHKRLPVRLAASSPGKREP